MVYLGVPESSNAHRLYDPVQKKVVVGRDVIFEEAVGWKWSENSVENLMGFQIDDEFDNNNRNWGTIEVDDEAPQPQQEQGGAQVSESSSSVPDELQSPAAVSSADANAGSPLQENSESHNLGQQLNPELIDDLSDEEPQHFRSLNEMYQNTDEVELVDSEGVEANEPGCYTEAAGNLVWVEAMNNEI